MSNAPHDLAALRQHAFALREMQRYAEAEVHFAAGTEQFPSDPGLAFGLAQTRFELGHRAAHLFAQAAALAGDHPDIARNQALALIAEGRSAEARELLAARLARCPDWLDGHKALAVLKWTAGDRLHFSDHLGTACHAQPDNAALWLAWFRNLAQTRDWNAALEVLDQAERHLGSTPAIAVSRLFVAVESAAPNAADLIAATAHFRGDVSSLCRIRHALRSDDASGAEVEALPLTQGPSAALYWPYLSLAWRLMGDGRADWLDRPDVLIQTMESSLSAAELDAVAAVLRNLHTAAQPYLEQSVRGGTQTDRSVLLRHEPELAALRIRLLDLVAEYIAALPPPDPAHPLLGAGRSGPLLIEGSWSVRLAGQGHNVPHTHAMGWLSTAFYVSLPAQEKLGAAPSGHLALGTPPAELALPLEPYRTIEPAAGRLAVFPSTMWHSTVPFDNGERLVVAFDIRRPITQDSAHAV